MLYPSSTTCYCRYSSTIGTTGTERYEVAELRKLTNSIAVNKTAC